MKWILALAIGGATIGAFLVPPAGGFMEPDLARIVFFHLPAAFATVVFLIWGAITGLKYLRTREWVWELRSAAANEMAAMLAITTMATGIVFSRVQWGKWWHWDVRQTSFLVVLLLLGAYFALRSAFDEPIVRARAASAYSVITLLPVLFLVFVFPRLPQVAKTSLHPSDTVAQGKFDGSYWTVVLGMFGLMMVLCVWLYKLHVRSASVIDALREIDGNLETDSNGAAADRVVRPVSVR